MGNSINFITVLDTKKTCLHNSSLLGDPQKVVWEACGQSHHWETKTVWSTDHYVQKYLWMNYVSVSVVDGSCDHAVSQQTGTVWWIWQDGNSPESWKSAPKTLSVAEHRRLSLTEEQMPRTRGTLSLQEVRFSMIRVPLSNDDGIVNGWYTVVVMWSHPSSWVNLRNKVDWN